MSFWEKYNHSTNLHKSYVCLGLDTDIDLIPKHLLNNENPVYVFNKEIIDATKNLVGAYKLNFAFYLANGYLGLDALIKTIKHIPKYIPVILDVKTGDIANTMVQYAKAFYHHFKADALTINPLMGEDVITPLKTYKDKFSFVLVVTSNRTAEDFLKKNHLYKDIALKVKEWGTKHTGAVIGATNPLQLRELREMMPETLFLIPGIGAQGGNLIDVINGTVASRKDPLILINSSRGIIYKDSGKQYIDTVIEATSELRNSINRLL